MPEQDGPVYSSTEDYLTDSSRGITTVSSQQWNWRGFHLGQSHHSLREIVCDSAIIPTHIITVYVGCPRKFAVSVEGRKQSFSSVLHDINIQPSGPAYRFEFDGQENEAVFLNFAPSRLLEIAAGTSHAPKNAELIPKFELRDPQIERLTFALHEEATSGGPSGRLFADSVITALGTRLLTQYAVCPLKLPECVRGLGRSDLRRVLDFIGDNLSDDLSLDALAAAVDLSPSHFLTLFRQSTDQSPHQYVIRQRVERAKTLLLTTRMSIGEVAHAAGFAHQSHLHRHMRRLFGITPKMLRESS